MNSSFPNRWSFSYLKFTKYVTNIIDEPKYKHRQQEHISNICKKASRQLGVLKRTGENLCKLGILSLYYSFILSNFNYCPLTWHFCGETNTSNWRKYKTELYASYIMTVHQIMNHFSQNLKCQHLRCEG